jgi:hypothetical protein
VPPMHWIDSVPPLSPLIEKLKGEEFRIFYRGAEPIKGFAVYTLPRHEEENIDNADLVQIIVADKTIDLNLDEVNTKDREKIFISAVDKNNNVSEWVQLR